MDDPRSKLFELLEQFKIPIALSLIGLTLIVGGMIVSGIGKNTARPSNFPKESIVDAKKGIRVDISGAVVKPGVYELPLNSIVEDAINLAGGLAQNANGEYISKYLNMALKLTDGMKIYVPFVGEPSTYSTGSGQGGVVAGSTVYAKVNINTSSQSELEALPGIGPVTAAKIISGRPYQKIEDLLTQKIVSKSTFEKIKDSITIF